MAPDTLPVSVGRNIGRGGTKILTLSWYFRGECGVFLGKLCRGTLWQRATGMTWPSAQGRGGIADGLKPAGAKYQIIPERLETDRAPMGPHPDIQPCPPTVACGAGNCMLKSGMVCNG